MILSASGWRGIFAEEGDEKSPSPSLSPAHRIIAGGAALAFSEFLGRREGGVILGMDTRPTGPAIGEAILAVLLALGREAFFGGILCAPEIMALARAWGRGGKAAGFIYISASHNPLGHNGLKFGFCDGGVLPRQEALRLTECFKALLESPQGPGRIEQMLREPPATRMREVYARQEAVKREALGVYRAFTDRTITGFEDEEAAAAILGAIREGLAERPLGICADFNGSARTLSIDRDYLKGLGVSFQGIHDRPGEIVHGIVPEGDNLETCRFLLEETHLEDGITLLGYVPDCDGDRGNLVVWDKSRRGGRILEAQEVFALSCAAELSYLVWTGELRFDNKGNALSKAAVAANGPTSLRIDRIARAFDVPVFRAETGEANVVGLARRLREQGCIVRVLGEGSAGGTIIHPSSVRDPLDTLGGVLKFFALRSTGARPGLFKIWCDLSGQTETYREDFSLEDLIASLPAFVTTGIYSPEAKLQVKTEATLLKGRYQDIFLREWESRREELRDRYGIFSWEVSVYNGMEERRGLSDFSEAGPGGLKIYFNNAEGARIASIWMRGSGTEPVFRIAADAEGSDRRMERDLIAWQRRMVIDADAKG